MLDKLAYSIELSFDIPEAEKQLAVVASERFHSVITELDLAKDHLNIMYDPFKKIENISSEALQKKRGVLNRFKQKVKENYNKVKIHSLKAIQVFNNFTSDGKAEEMQNGFKNSISDLEKQVNIFLEILDDHKSPEFKNSVIAGIDNIKKQSAQIETLVKDRIIEYIDTNILAKNWVSDTSNTLHTQIKNKLPLIKQLFEERQKALNPALNLEKRPQIVNPGNAQRIYNPTDIRNPDNTGVYPEKSSDSSGEY